MSKLTDDGIASMLLYGIGQAVGYSDSKLSKERERVLQYYQGELPRVANGGVSGYRSLDVYDGVESMKAQLLETFSGNNRPVQFVPANAQDAAPAQVRTDYVTHVLYDQNDAFGIYQTIIDDGLLGRCGVAKVWWEDQKKVTEYDLSDAAAQDMAAFMSQHPDASVQDIELDEDGVTIKRARFSVPEDRSQVRIKALPPEEFGVSPMAEDIETADLVFHRQTLTVSELLAMGYPKSVVMSLPDNDKTMMSMDPERIVRYGETDDLIGVRSTEFGQKSARSIPVYECYVNLDLADSGEARLYRVTLAGGQVLDKEPVDRKPFAVFCPLPRPHAFWGHNYAELLIPTQQARTHLTRSIVNHALITNNPRFMVTKGAVQNPRELMENRVGGIINVTRPDGIAPLPQSGLNPFVFQTISLLDQDKQEITGISQLSQGLDKDAISKQNSQGMVRELISVSQVRQKIVARNFAEGFLRRLYTLIYELVLENEDRQKIVYLSGSWSPVDFTQWPLNANLEVAFSLGYGEDQKEAQKWQMIDAYLSHDPTLTHAYPPQKRYEVVKRALNAMGVKDVDTILLRPDQVQPPQPDPMHQADIAVKQADAQVKLANAQAAKLNSQLALQEAQQKRVEGLAKINLETTKASNDFDLKRDEFAHKVAIDSAELAFEHLAAQQDRLTAVAQPSH